MSREMREHVGDSNKESVEWKVLYEFYLKSYTKRRDEAIELLKKRNFNSLHRNYIHWFEKKQKIVELESTIISDVVKELGSIKYKDNETEPTLSCFVSQKEGVFGGGYDTESSIKITSYIYTIVPFEKCESLARNYANSSLWKMKYQPNSKDAEGYRKILNRNK